MASSDVPYMQGNAGYASSQHWRADDAHWSHLPNADTERDAKILSLSQQVTSLTGEVSRLTGEIGELKQMIDRMGAKLAELLSSFNDFASTSEEDLCTSEVIIVEEMDKPTAKQMVIDFMREHRTSDIEELHKNIRCDIGLLIQIVDELYTEGIISGED